MMMNMFFLQATLTGRTVTIVITRFVLLVEVILTIVVVVPDVADETHAF